MTSGDAKKGGYKILRSLLVLKKNNVCLDKNLFGLTKLEMVLLDLLKTNAQN